MKTLLHTQILQEIAKENNLNIELLPAENSTIISNSNQSQLIYYFDFACNPHTSCLFAKDKYTAYELMKKNSIEAVEHIGTGYAQVDEFAEKYFKKYGKIVVKNQVGTCGDGVYLASNLDEVKNAVKTLKSKNAQICFSPFMNIEKECRIICVGGKANIVYEKIRPFVVGDGFSPISELIAMKFVNVPLETEKINKFEIPEKNKVVLLNWKHNLCKGATIEEIKDEKFKKELSKIAENVCKVFKLNACAVDIIKAENKLMVLEVNAGMMMESLARISKDYYEKTKQIYKDLIFMSFDK